MLRFNAVIATHGRSSLLQRTLDSLAKTKRPDGFERVIVIENGTAAGAEKECQRAESKLPIEYQHTVLPGKSRALQQVLETLGEGFVLFLDDDIRVCPQLLEVYAQAASEHGPDCFFGGPFQVDYQGDRPPTWLVDYLPWSAKGWNPADPQESLKWNRFIGFNYGVFVQRILAIGGFNPDIGPGALHAGTASNPVGQETEMQNRLLEDGCRPVYLPKAMVWHYVPHSRCTPRWTLHRWYRMAVTEGMSETKELEGPRWRGVPRWMYRRAAALWWQAYRPNGSCDKSGRFSRKKQYHQWRGYMAGLRIQSQSAAEKKQP